jgi:hypothetical protein
VRVRDGGGSGAPAAVVSLDRADDEVGLAVVAVERLGQVDDDEASTPPVGDHVTGRPRSRDRVEAAEIFPFLVDEPIARHDGGA